MTDRPTADPYIQALLAEDGQPVSAGARMSHVRDAIASGRAYYIDLSTVPEHKRVALIAELNELVRRAAETSAA